MKKVRFEIRVEPEILTAIRQLAAERQQSVSALAHHFLKSALQEAERHKRRAAKREAEALRWASLSEAQRQAEQEEEEFYLRLANLEDWGEVDGGCGVLNSAELEEIERAWLASR